MTGQPTRRSRTELAKRLRVALEQLESGRITVAGNGHTLAATKARIEKRLAELEGGDRHG